MKLMKGYVETFYYKDSIQRFYLGKEMRLLNGIRGIYHKLMANIKNDHSQRSYSIDTRNIRSIHRFLQ